MLIWVNKINYQGATVHVSPFDAFLVQSALFVQSTLLVQSAVLWQNAL